MRTVARVLLVGLLLTTFLFVSAGAALAASPQQECEAAGGTFSKTRGTQTCTFSETPGNNQGGVTKDTDVSQKGSSRSSHPEESQHCVTNNGGTHCPSGQNT